MGGQDGERDQEVGKGRERGGKKEGNEEDVQIRLRI